ncbi:helix-turn-helix domain-containing protein [Kitasatospora sp. NPDC052896]|uniref:helix-turn-helix domain-containing protein n=1 Tax=Kitasatospora sp. NPDC052896 TaxID=3364061 RepID=UPI0037CC808C
MTQRDYAQLFMVSGYRKRSSRGVSSGSSDLPDPQLLAIGMQIRRLREEGGYSLEQLAERSGLSFRGLIYIEHGQRNASVLTLLRIAAGLDVHPARLFDGLSCMSSPAEAGG